MSKLKPSFSIIIPTLNEERYIGKTLEWIGKQDYPDKYEVVVVDGGSKDKTVSIAKKFADKVLEIRANTAQQRNFGAKQTRKKILFFLDADTLIIPNTLSEFAKNFKGGVVCVTCLILPTKLTTEFLTFYSVYNINMRLSTKLNKPRIAGGCVAYERKAFKKVGGFDQRYNVFEDFRLSEKIIKFGKVKITEETVAFTSGRRIEKWGLKKSTGNYLKLYAKYLLKDLPKVKDYPVIR